MDRLRYIPQPVRFAAFWRGWAYAVDSLPSRGRVALDFLITSAASFNITQLFCFAISCATDFRLVRLFGRLRKMRSDDGRLYVQGEC
jgi:hypothetical protein